MSNQPRKHHYVPQCYLRYFARQHKNVWQTTVIDKFSNKIFPCNIEDVAAEHDYNRDKSKSDEFFWEKYYAKTVETDLPITFNNLIGITGLTQNEKPVLNDELKRKLSRIICIQMLRTPTMRNRNYNIAQSTAHEWIKEFKKENYRYLSSSQKQSVNRIKFNDDFYRQVELPFINDENRLNRFEKFLLERIWIIYRNPFYQYLPFITSDNPVNFYNFNKNSGNLADNGLLVNDTVINFPIIGQLLLCLYAPTNWLFHTKDFNNCVVDLQDNEKDLLYIVTTNRNQLKQCKRQAYTQATSKEIIRTFLSL
jgi:hypothetical protein